MAIKLKVTCQFCAATTTFSSGHVSLWGNYCQSCGHPYGNAGDAIFEAYDDSLDADMIRRIVREEIQRGQGKYS